MRVELGDTSRSRSFRVIWKRIASRRLAVAGHSSSPSRTASKFKVAAVTVLRLVIQMYGAEL
jgi:hypothetical protein